MTEGVELGSRSRCLRGRSVMVYSASCAPSAARTLNRNSHRQWSPSTRTCCKDKLDQERALYGDPAVRSPRASIVEPPCRHPGTGASTEPKSCWVLDGTREPIRASGGGAVCPCKAARQHPLACLALCVRVGEGRRIGAEGRREPDVVAGGGHPVGRTLCGELELPYGASACGDGVVWPSVGHQRRPRTGR